MHSSTQHTSNTDINQQYDEVPPTILPSKPVEIHQQQTVTDGPQQKLPVYLHLNMTSPAISSTYLTQDTLIALGLQDGSVNVIASNKGSTQYILKSLDKSPVSGMSLNPDLSLRNSILLTHADGTLQYWHTTSKQLLFSKKYDQFLYCCQISPDGTKYVFGGDNGTIKLSNMNKGKPLELEEGHFGAHSNRVFCVKWSKDDPNMFVSGGWDKSVLFWDIRTKTTTFKLFGCYMGGKSIDIDRNYVLLGNNLNQNQIRVYDMKAGKMHVTPWHHYSEQSLHGITGVVNCCFALNSNKDVFVQTSRNEVRLYKDANKCVAWLQNEENSKGFSMSHAGSKRQLVVTWNNGDVKILNYD